MSLDLTHERFYLVTIHREGEPPRPVRIVAEFEKDIFANSVNDATCYTGRTATLQPVEIMLCDEDDFNESDFEGRPVFVERKGGAA